MNFIKNFPIFITSQVGMKKNLLAAFFGVLVALALPPVYILPLAIVGFSGFVLMILAEGSLKSAFKLGWWFGFGHFTAGLYWIAFALLVDVEDFGWLIPFAVFGIPAVIAVYTGIVAMIIWKAAKYINGWRLIVVFSCVWTIVEMLRGWLFTGFPWNLAGYMMSVSDNMLQLTSITGIWGLSLVTVLAFAMPASLVSGGQWVVGRNNLVPVLMPFALLAVIFAWGGYRLATNETVFVPNVKLRIVQANIPQNMKWEDESINTTVEKYIKMSTSEGFESVTHVVWPETALPFIISENAPFLGEIAKAAPINGAIITGVLQAEFRSDGSGISKIFNSLVVITSKAQLYSRYDKSHLVPFGEYVPLRGILPLEKITKGSLDFTEGGGAKTINAPNFPGFSGLVCYEVIFPGKVVDENNRPKVMINVTNDAWYGNTSGPYQHFQMTRVRAVEEGIPLIRSANNGISAVIDGYGRVINKTRLSTAAIMDSSLPSEISHQTTYSRCGDLISILGMVFLLLITCKNAIIRNDFSKKM